MQYSWTVILVDVFYFCTIAIMCSVLCICMCQSYLTQLTETPINWIIPVHKCSIAETQESSDYTWKIVLYSTWCLRFSCLWFFSFFVLFCFGWCFVWKFQKKVLPRECVICERIEETNLNLLINNRNLKKQLFYGANITKQDTNNSSTQVLS